MLSLVTQRWGSYELLRLFQRGSINSEPPPPYLSTQFLSMSAANITKAALPEAGSAPSTVPKFAAAHEAHIHHHRGIIGRSRAQFMYLLRGAAFAQDSRINTNPNTTNHFTWNSELSTGLEAHWVGRVRARLGLEGQLVLSETDVWSAWPLLRGAHDRICCICFLSHQKSCNG
ncbi:hypothetical protein BGY98DRAFT_573977 [Russula aff. rugulosa BPL654]|nr:hypothetical protein BGY98DRAFT_573977 [Russula aff. rugulosa BPL654]